MTTEVNAIVNDCPGKGVTSVPCTGLIDTRTRKIIFTGGSYGRFVEQYVKKTFIGKSAKVWFAEWPNGSGNQYVYQLEVEGRLIYTLDSVNAYIDQLSTWKNLFLICLFILPVVALLFVPGGYGTYQSQMKEQVAEKKEHIELQNESFITTEEYSIARRKLIRNFWGYFCIFPLIGTMVFLGTFLKHGTSEKIETKNLRDLRVVKGTYYIDKDKINNRHISNTSLIDPQTREVIFSGRDIGAGVYFEKFTQITFVEKPATVWYFPEPDSYGILNIYQLEINGILIYTLDESNQLIPLLNKPMTNWEDFFRDIGVLSFLNGLFLFIFYRYRIKQLHEKGI